MVVLSCSLSTLSKIWFSRYLLAADRTPRPISSQPRNSCSICTTFLCVFEAHAHCRRSSHIPHCYTWTYKLFLQISGRVLPLSVVVARACTWSFWFWFSLSSCALPTSCQTMTSACVIAAHRFTYCWSGVSPFGTSCSFFCISSSTPWLVFCLAQFENYAPSNPSWVHLAWSAASMSIDSILAHCRPVCYAPMLWWAHLTPAWCPQIANKDIAKLLRFSCFFLNDHRVEQLLLVVWFSTAVLEFCLQRRHPGALWWISTTVKVLVAFPAYFNLFKW